MTKKIRLFVDAEVLIAPHFSGIGHYTLEMLKALDRAIDNRNDIDVTLGVYFRRAYKLQPYGFKNFKIKRSPFPLRISNSLKIRGWQPPYDLFFGRKIYLFPNYSSWPLLFSKSITVIYDLSYELYPQYVEPRNQKFLSKQVKLSVKRSSRLITISHNSQKEIMDYYKIPESRISIISPGIDQTQFYKRSIDEIEETKARYNIYGKYILFVGNIEPRKNLKTLLLAYEKLKPSTRSKYSLLLIGAPGWLDKEIFNLIKRLRIAGNHIQQPLTYVKDEDRPALYSGAGLFVYPSLYEGFGIPPLEAMACGVPVIASNNSSLPEAVGDAAKTVNATSVNELANAIELILQNGQLRQKMTSDGFRQVDGFSWDKEVTKFIKLLEDDIRK